MEQSHSTVDIQEQIDLLQEQKDELWGILKQETDAVKRRDVMKQMQAITLKVQIMAKGDDIT